jgi:hypothetical protein
MENPAYYPQIGPKTSDFQGSKFTIETTGQSFRLGDKSLM